MSSAPVRAAVARLGAAGLWLSAMLAPSFGEAQSWPAEFPPDSAVVLDVPYLPQSVLLCGGAALAMVERWWGRRGVYPEEFATLVRPALGGIRTVDLDSAARARGWNAEATRGTRTLVQQLLWNRVPIIALVEIRRNQFHYVVVLGWHAGEVVFHDPATGPLVRLAEVEFLSRWAAADEWTLIVRPPAVRPPEPSSRSQSFSPPLPPADSMPCRPWLDRAVDAVAANRLDTADNLLDEAARACPREPLVGRELAGVRFKQGRHLESVELIARYLRVEPGDALAWQLLATGRYLVGDLTGALDAWNQIDRPQVDLVVIRGSRSIRHGQLLTAIGVSHGSTLTAGQLALARRRLQDVPAIRSAIVSYRPVPGGVVELQATVAERSKVPPPWWMAVTSLAGAVTQEAVALEVNNATGAGERWSARWRWERARPLASLLVEIPARLGIPGVIGLEGAREGMRVALDAQGSRVLEDRWRSVRLGFGAWLTGHVRPRLTVGLDRWSGARSYLTLQAGGELHGWDDRLRLSVTGTRAVALEGHPGWQQGGARAMWASSLGLDRAAWSARLGGDWTSSGTPLGAWPIAGGSLARSIPLRAEPSPHHDFLAGRAAGRGIVHGGLGGDVPVYRMGPLVLAVGAFLDGARVLTSADAMVRDRNYLDGGLGVRVGVAGGELGVLRVDLARGLLADRRSALTVGVHLAWPVFPQVPR